MQFQILGPLEVHGEHGPVALGGAKPRAVLAVLLLHANEAVSAERLALALWGEDAPGGAVKTVQVHVSRLRKALGDAEVISTTPAGYSLRVRPDELDAARFERLVEDGRQALADGQAEHASTVLREALGLWRGGPLGDLALEPFAQSETARLAEGRLSAIEARVEADLAAGRHADLVGELQRLVADHPLRELLAGQLMLALYRCGRQTEALEVYGSARTHLIAEIGIEPGPELRRLQEAILRQDASLEPEPSIAELPRELDAATAPPLLGRDPELDWLVDRWERARTGAGALVGLAGGRGSGKTRLAAQIAGRVHAAQGAVIYASGAHPPQKLHEALRRARETERATLLVIDDADRSEHGVLVGLRELAAVGGLLVLLTGEDAPALERLGAPAVLELAPLDADAARAIAMLYAPGRPFEDVPAQWLVESSDGVARRLHELASQWARREAARRVGAVAGRAAAGREQLRSIQDELTGGVEELQAADERVARADTDDSRVVCPFKGLAAFDVADAPYFFGRERLIAELVARLVGAPLLGIVGPSGSGKSSVTRAGLLPALAGGVLPGSHEWARVLMRPGEHPMRELARALARAGEAPRIVIVVDQFEETFTTCEDEQERAEFIAELGAAAADRAGRYVVVMALRADFYGRCATYPELSGPLAANHVLVGSMQRDELRRAIERPAERAGLRVDPELADALIADLRDEPGALPLLQTALLELWQRRDGRRLRHSAYEQAGGVRGAVARLAEDAFAALDEAQQALARGVLMRLASEGAAGGVERRRISLAELEVDRSEELARAVALLTDRRLLTASAGSIELAHEALLREWPRLRDWVQENREGLRVHRNLGAAAREWKQLGQDEGALYRGARLAEAGEWAAANPQSLNEVERAFLGASEAVRQQEQIQRRRRIRFALGGLSVAVVLISAVALVAILQSREAGRQRDIAASRGLAASATTLLDVDPALSLELALQAMERRDTAQAENVLRQATFAARALDVWPTHSTIARALSVSGDGRIVATGGDDGVVAVRRMDSGAASTFKGKVAVISAAISPDGTRVVAGRDDGTVTSTAIDGAGARSVVDLGGETVAAYETNNYASALTFSADGARIAVGGLDGTVRVVRADGAGAAVTLRAHEAQVNDVVLSRDGTRVLSTGYDDGVVRVSHVPSATSVVLAHKEAQSADLSPDGRRVATAGLDGVIRVWRSDGTGRPREIRVGQPLLSVRFSRDGRRLVTSGADSIVRISDVRGGPVLDMLKRHRGAVSRAAFLANGQVVSTGEDGTLRRWAPLDAAILRGPFVGASFNSDGTRVLTGATDGRARVLSSKTGARIAAVGPDSDTTTARYSPDATKIITASLDGVVRIADPQTGRSRIVVERDLAAAKRAADIDRSGRRIASGGDSALAVVQTLAGGGKPVVLEGHRGGVTDVRFSPDGASVLTAAGDGTARIWDAASGKPLRTLEGHGETVNTAEYRADGERIVTAGTDGTVRVWRTRGSGRPVVLRGHEGAVNGAAFNHDGTRVVSAGVDGSVRVWDAAGGDTLVVLHTHPEAALSARFSADSTAVVSTGADRVAWVIPCEVCTSLRQVQRLARTRADRALDATERQRFLPDDG